jgi:hypothetical protein
MHIRMLSRIVLATVLLTGTATIVRAGGKGSPSEYGKVEFGPKELAFEDGCAQVDGHLTSGKFFDDLKRTNLHVHLEFTKRGAEVTEYPDSVTGVIRLVGGQCVSALSDATVSVFSGNAYALSFQVQWKTGMQLRPASLASGAAQCEGYSSIILPYGDAKIPMIVCRLTINSRGVPLADHLIVSLFGSDGTRLTRLSAAP